MNQKVIFYILIILMFAGGAIKFFIDSSYITGILFLIVAGIFTMRIFKGGKRYEGD